ncbi:MAG TPA: hypothetical protein VL357_03120 [Rariglobus sp.]|jgi:hypothetical protein|nr:hypothetical protein [Rariglobus sp.]
MSDPALIAALEVAYRHYGDTTTTEIERDAILAAMSAHMNPREAQIAAASLHHRLESRIHQLQLTDLLTRAAS